MSSRLLNFAGHSNSALSQNGAHVFAATHALCIYRSNAIYTLIPKNACSTMRFSIAVANEAITRRSDVRWIHMNNATFIGSIRDLATADFTFVILRCPFDRLASCFLNKIVDMRPDAWALTPPYESDVNPADMCFRDFVEYLHDKKKLKANVHWRPQSDFLVYRTYDRYFDFARMQEVAVELRERIQLEVIDTRDRIGHEVSRLKRVEGSFAETPVRDLARMKQRGEAPTLKSLFDTKSWELVEHLYAEDLRNYRELAGGREA